MPTVRTPFFLLHYALPRPRGAGAVRTPDWSRPMGFYPSLQGLPYPYVGYVCLCVSHFCPRRGFRRPSFADVGPKVLIRYSYHFYGAQFLCWRLSLGEDGKSPTY